jgi:hypothetical protein
MPKMAVFSLTTDDGRSYWVVDPTGSRRPTVWSSYFRSWPLAISVADRQARRELAGR